MTLALAHLLLRRRRRRLERDTTRAYDARRSLELDRVVVALEALG
ncbi:MAG: hypothetical protein ACREVS_04515 [Burkholderiales bacterium]